MITQQLRRAGNSFVVTIPKEEVERHGWEEGQLLAIELTEIDQQPRLRPELKKFLDERWERNEAALRYLAER
jgi:antitoxin component of MazEF toxin-antitoxin module